jgi:beta-glucosidase
MNKLNSFILTAILFTLIGCSKSSSLTEQEKITEQRIDSIMSQMTLEEKVGQMAQYTIDVIGKSTGNGSSVEPFQFDKAKLDTVLRQYKAGSILNTTNNKAQTTETWAFIVKTIQEIAITETGIPVIYGVDAIHGTTYTASATFFPQQIGSSNF